jgi:hypothetical protein
MPQHLAGVSGQLHGLGHVAPGPAVVLALGLGDANNIFSYFGKTELMPVLS